MKPAEVSLAALVSKMETAGVDVLFVGGPMGDYSASPQ
jgi:hypothetical protein